MTFQNLQLAYAAGSYADIQDVSDIATTSLTGTYNFSLTEWDCKTAQLPLAWYPGKYTINRRSGNGCFPAQLL